MTDITQTTGSREQRAGRSVPAPRSLLPDVGPSRATLLRRALRLEYLTVAWNVVEGVVAVAAAGAAGSVALLGFGVESFVESASGGVLVWRLRAERARGALTNQGPTRADAAAIERVERRARRLVALSLWALAAYVAAEAALTLWRGERPSPSAVGIALTVLSLVVMRWLARAKRHTARALGSRAMEADAVQTSACMWLSLIVLAGIGVNAVLGWWWADPVAAIGMTVFIAREGAEAWRGEDCCGGGCAT